jgi:hypothetical protein
MRTRATLIAGTIALAICVLCPLVDLFDQWDHALQTGSDSEYPLVILALCVGLVLALGRLIPKLSMNLQASSILRYAIQSTLNSLAFSIPAAVLAFASASPPLSLRI